MKVNLDEVFYYDGEFASTSAKEALAMTEELSMARKVVEMADRYISKATMPRNKDTVDMFIEMDSKVSEYFETILGCSRIKAELRVGRKNG